MKPHGSIKEYLEVAAQPRSTAAACPDEAQVVEFYLGRLDETRVDAIQDHLSECPRCFELARDARQFLKAMSEPVDAAVAEPAQALGTTPTWRPQGRRLLLLAASLVIVVGGGLLLWRTLRVEAPPEQAQVPSATPGPTVRENPWRDLQIAKAQYIPATSPPEDLIFRDDSRPAPAPGRRSSFARAMQSYERNDFAEAERRLAEFVKENPKHGTAQFYRGVSLLLLGKNAEAVVPLEAAANGEGEVAEEAHWYLAQTYLKTGDHTKALEQLDVVIQTSGKHRADAEQLRQQVKQVMGQRAASND